MSGNASTRRRTLTSIVGTIALAVVALSAPAQALAPAGTASGVNVTAGDAMITIAWIGATGAGVTNNYQPRAWSAASGGSYGGNWCAGGGGNGPCNIAGLTNGTTYYVDVYDTITGTSSSPRVAVTPTSPITAPGAPTGVTARVRDGSTVVAWLAPASTGGAPLSTYFVLASTSAPGAVSSGTCSTTTLTCTISGLTNGATYGVRVSASNTSFEGPPSSPDVAVTPLGAPGPPTGVSALAGDGRATVSWSAPSSTGGGPITDYWATAYPLADSTSGGPFPTCVTTGALTCTISNLTNGQTYYVRVSALNSSMGSRSGAVAVTPVAPSSSGGGASGGGSGSSSGGSAGGGGSGGSTSGESAGQSTGGGSSSASSRPTITGISPARGPVKGGTVITIRGTNLTATSKVTIGGVRAPKVVVVNATTLRVTTPKGKAGKRAVTVTTPAGTTTKAGAFVYQGRT